jgi:hypothetical protein
MIARAAALGIILSLAAACPSSRPTTPPPPPPPPDAAGSTLPADIERTDPLPSPTAPVAARVHLAPTKVSWPADRTKAQFHALGGGTRASVAYAVSGDGSTPAGYAAPDGGDDEAVRWRNGTMEPLAVPDATDDTTAWAHTLSFDGRVVAGASREKGGAWRPMLWNEGDPPRRLPLPKDSEQAQVFGLSKDGTIVVGCGGRQCEDPVRWTGDYVATIDGPRPFTLGAHPITTNAQIVVGMTDDRAARIESGGVILKDQDSFAYSISDDGKVIVGRQGKQAVMWRGKKATALGTLPGHDSCRAVAVSADAGRVVGNCSRPGGSTAWVWDAKNGMRSVADALAALKIDTIGWSLDEVNDICSYGMTLVGSGAGPGGTTQAWMAIIPRWP